ncbi:uncharacterized protein LOC143891109 [Tasmannia lanceolata]|uniref:uncharacterized protein LOC143891109 n=1 Tax=Tasmannia lanceolata TaxID=3420 RepID=UPI004063CBBB
MSSSDRAPASGSYEELVRDVRNLRTGLVNLTTRFDSLSTRLDTLSTGFMTVESQRATDHTQMMELLVAQGKTRAKEHAEMLRLLLIGQYGLFGLCLYFLLFMDAVHAQCGLYACLSDELYDFYNDSQDSKSLWEALQKKYDTEEAGSKKYAVSKYFRFYMVDERTVISQTHELQKLVNDILAEGMVISEQFQVATMIDKLPPSWTFRNSLLHKSKELSMESLLVRLRIEEENRNQDKKEENVSNVNVFSVFQSPNQKPQVNLKPKKKSMKRKHNQNQGTNKSQNQNPKKNTDYSKVVCYNCGLKGHISRMCRQKKGAQVPQANVTEEPLVAMITEVNAVGGSNGRWADTGASRHVCYDRSWFKTYASVESGNKVLLGDSHTTKVLGTGDVELRFTSWRKVMLKDVLHTLEMRNNLVSEFLLNKARFKQTIEFDQYIVTKHGSFVGKGYELAAIHNLVIHQLDVKTAFLNGSLEEEIYMDQPDGFVAFGQENKVCKLLKSLYGLKQAPKQWYEKFDNIVISNGFKINEINKTKNLLMQNFDIKDLGEANVILEIKITRSENGISLDQSHYIEKILKKYKYFDCKPVCTPFDLSVRLYSNDGDSVNQKEYASIIGSLRYAIDCTRPDIAYAVGLLCRYTSCPSIDHWNAISRVMRYLKRTITNGIHFQRFPAVLEGFSDADWNTLSEDSKATTSYVFTIDGGVVSWRTKKETIIAQSTMASELIALTFACEEATWLKNFLPDIPVWYRPMYAVLIHCDSMAAIGRVQNKYYNGKSRQI